MRKNWTSLVLTLLLCFALIVPAAATTAQASQPLVIASATRLSGAFFTNQWGANTSDLEVRALVNGYATAVLTSQNTFAVNQTVVDQVAEEEENGQKTFLITLKDGLLWDDGSPITAKDYVFSLLLQASPAMRSLGGSPADLSYLAGFADYAQEQTEVFSGLRLVDEQSFSLTVSAEALPYFYQTSYLMVDPYPMAVLAPGAQVVDSEDGAKLEPALTADLLRQTILDPASGYLVRPVPGSGPYRLVNYDAAAGTADFEINPHFLGDHRGQKPSIPALRFIQASGQNALDGLKNKTIDILHKLVDGNTIAGAQQLPGVEAQPYARRGYAYFAFDAKDGATAHKAVRQAFAHCVDTAILAKEYTQGYGWPVYGDYGFGHWAAARAAGINQIVNLPSLDGQAFAAFDALPLMHYGVDLNKAQALLEDAGYILNAQGEAFVPGAGQVRHRKTDQGLEALALNWLQPEGSRLNQLAQSLIQSNLQAAGFQLQVQTVPQTEFFESFYGREPQGFNLYLLATNFLPAYDPHLNFSKGSSIAYSLQDEEPGLMAAALALRQTPEGDSASYISHFMAYQQTYNEVLPTLPVYSNIYFDFYQNNIRDYQPQSHDSVASAILYASR